MNILLISYEFPPFTASGGIGSYMFHLANLLSDNGQSVTIFSAKPGSKIVENVINEKFRHFCIPAENNDEFKTNALFFFDKYISDNKVDVIESPEVGACAILIKRKYPAIPLIVKLHAPGVLITKISAYYQPLKSKLRFILGALIRGKFDAGYWSNKDKNQFKDDEYLICDLAETILSPSLALKKWAVKFWGIAENKIQVVPNAFSLNQELFSYLIDNRPEQISFVGKLSILKGMFALTKAIPVLLDNNLNLKIVLVGRDEIENGISMKTFMQNSLSAYTERVIFTGTLTSRELSKIYEASKVCIFPSLWENYPTVILEAMAAGATVVAGNCGGIPEIIINNKTGILVNTLQPNQIAKSVNNLLKNDTHRKNIAINARENLRNTLLNGNFKQTILNVYQTNFSQKITIT